MSDREIIKHFVRGSLGCACDDAVFERIDRSRETPGAGACGTRLLIGGRLLVRVIAPVDANAIAANLQRWLAIGDAERDANGLTRFRLVLGCDEPAALRAQAQAIFEECGARNGGRTHLHVLDRRALAEIGLCP